MSKYKHIFFDLDHTLWDYDLNASKALSDLYEMHNLSALALFRKEEFTDVFFKVNHELWTLYDQNLIQRDDIRERRFVTVFEKLGAKAEQMPSNLEQEYIALAPTKPHTFDNAHKVLDYLSVNYELHMITNGFKEIQSVKLKNSGLEKYFDIVVTSETTRYRKPDKEIFELAMQRANASVEQSIMIGDNLEADIAGAINANMDHVWFNPSGVKTDVQIQHEIQNLIELKNIL